MERIPAGIGPFNGENITSFVPDGKYVGLHTDLIDELANFNLLYDTDLQMKNTFHWKNGTYDKIRTLAVENGFKWLNHKPRGSSTITSFQKHGYDNFRAALLGIEDKMSNKRWHKYVMGDEHDTGDVKWNRWLDAFIESVEKMTCHNLQVPTIGTGFYGRRYRNGGHGRNAEFSWSRIATDKIPRIQLIFTLDKIDYNIYYYSDLTGNYELMATIPFGSLEIRFEIDIYWWVNTLGNNSNHIMRRNSDKMTVYGEYHPYLKGLNFLYMTADGHAFNNGNICFGDHEHTIYKYVHQMKFDALNMYLNAWATRYNIGGSRPLNQLKTCHVGMNPEWAITGKEKVFKDKFNADPDTCKRVLLEEFDNNTNEFRESLCSQCLLSDYLPDALGNCRLYHSTMAKDSVNPVSELIDVIVACGGTAAYCREIYGNTIEYFSMNISNCAQCINSSSDENIQHIIERALMLEQIWRFNPHQNRDTIYSKDAYHDFINRHHNYSMEFLHVKIAHLTLKQKGE